MADESAEGTILLARQDSVATVTLNRPGRGNSLTAAMKTALRETLATLAADQDVRAVVLTGSGRAFCAGQDLAEHAETLRADPSTAFSTLEEHYNPIVMALTTMPKPVVAAINGSCAGAGLGLALACDLRVTAEGARFGTAFTAIGLTCDSGLSASLARAVGTARASELVLLGEPFTAQQALDWGIAGRLAPAAEVLDTALALAHRLAAGPTLAYAEAKRALAESWDAPLKSVLAAESAAQARLGHSVDHRRAVDAFLAKEKPIFTGT